MKRRKLITLLTSAPATWPLFTLAQKANKVFRVGLLSTINPRSAPVFMALEQGMRELGYSEGKSWIFEFRNAEGQPERLPELATELVNLPVDVLIASGPEATLQAASQATKTIPIVTIAINYDPVAKGYIDNLARPGGNITGVFFMQVMLSAKRLSLLKQAIPELSRVFLLYDAHSPEQLQATEVAAQSLGLELQSLELKNPPYDFDHAMGVAVRDRAQGLVVLSSPAFFRQRSQIVALTVKYRLPEIFLFRFFVEAGELMAYGANLFDMFRHGASYVDKILKGANPAELPVEQPTQFELVVNLKTAEALNLTLPPSILLQATEVIE